MNSFPRTIELGTAGQQCGFAVDAPNTRDWRPQRAKKLQLNPDYCLKEATHQIGAGSYCALHAGSVLLALALDAQRASLADRLRDCCTSADAGAPLEVQTAVALMREAANMIATNDRLVGSTIAENVQ